MVRECAMREAAHGPGPLLDFTPTSETFEERMARLAELQRVVVDQACEDALKHGCDVHVWFQRGYVSVALEPATVPHLRLFEHPVGGVFE